MQRAWSIAAVGLSIACTESKPKTHPDATVAKAPVTAANDDANVKAFCKRCHVFPDPKNLPAMLWPKEVDKMYELAKVGPDTVGVPPRDTVKAYYTERAPKSFPLPFLKAYLSKGDIALTQRGLRPKGAPPLPGVSSTRFVKLTHKKKLDLLITDMRHGAIVLARPWAKGSPAELIGKAKHPADADVADIDGDGVLDIVVADLATFGPAETSEGRVIWLRGKRGGGFEAIELITGLGRAAAVRARDLDGDGDVDLAVGVFGYLQTGEVVVYENRGGRNPAFIRHQLDARPGTTEVAIVDVDGDGKLDVVAPVSQHFEEVVAYLQRDGMRWEAKVLYQAPNPDWGLTRIMPIDLDGDGDQDIMVTNGDVMDTSIPKPFHGVRWLENKGRYPFESHLLTAFPGVHGIGAGDLDGDGDLDLAASAFVPAPTEAVRKPMGYRAVIWLEQIAAGKFVPHKLRDVRADHPSLDIADYDADGDPDLVVGNFVIGPTEAEGVLDYAIIWDNQRK